MTRPAADVIEDLDFLDSTGVGAVEAARRLEFPTPSSLEAWLRNHHRSDLWTSLKRRDPAGTHLSGSDRKRRNEVDLARKPEPLLQLLDEADASDRASHRRKADRIRALLSELRADLEADRERQEQAREARAEVERLSRELAEAKARLRGGPAPKPSIGDARTIREWAAEHGVEVPATGRVPKSVREAYESAQSVAS